MKDTKRLIDAIDALESWRTDNAPSDEAQNLLLYAIAQILIVIAQRLGAKDES